MQAYNLAITDLTKELDHLKAAFEVLQNFAICNLLFVIASTEVDLFMD